MKTKKILLVLIIAGLLSASGYGLYRLGLHQGARQNMPTDNNAQTGSTADKHVLYWHDPMVPGHKFDKPGKSPFMDMQLVPVYANEDSGEGKVSISPRVQQNLGIRTVEVIKKTLTPTVEAIGNVAYNERDVAVIQARANGYLEHLHVRAPLDSVRAGQVLADLYVPDWITAQENYLSVRRMGENAPEGLLDGARQRMRLAGMSDAHIHLVESSSKVHSHLTVTAPIDGVVVELSAHEGMAVMPGTSLFRLNGVSTVWVNAEVPESLAAQIRSGDAVEVKISALPNKIFQGKINAILPEINQTTHKLKARIELMNSEGQLMPGMLARIHFALGSHKEALLIPSEAVIQTGKRSVAMIAQGGGNFMPVEIETGVEANGQTEVRKGLEAGQKVVVSGQFLIDSEASLKGVAARMHTIQNVPDNHPTGKVAAGTGTIK